MAPYCTVMYCTILYYIQFNSIELIPGTSRWLVWWFRGIGSELSQIRPTAIPPNRHTTSRQPNSYNWFPYIHPNSCTLSTQKLNLISYARGSLSWFTCYNNIKIPQKLSSALGLVFNSMVSTYQQKAGIVVVSSLRFPNYGRNPNPPC